MIDFTYLLSSTSLLITTSLAFNWLVLWRTNYWDRFFYHQVNHIINEKNSGKYWLSYHLEHGTNIALYMIANGRIAAVAFRMARNSDQMAKYTFDDGSYDFMHYFMSQFATVTDHYFPYLVICLFSFTAYAEYHLFICTPTDTITWQKYNDLAIENAQTYERCLVKKYSAKRKEWTVRFDRRSFAATRLTHLSTLSVRTRLLFIKRISLMDRLIQASSVGLAIALNLLLVYYFIVYSSFLPFLFHPLLAFDLFFSGYTVHRTYQVMCVMLHCNQACVLLYITHLNEATARLKQLLQHYRKSQKLLKKTKSHYTQYCLCYFLQEHTKMVVVVNTVNVELWGGILWYTVLLNVPTNVYLLYRFLHLYNHPGIQQMIILFILIVQFGMIFIALLALASASKAFHKAKAFLPAVQLSLAEDRYLLYKLKYMELFERVNSEKKYGNTIGSMATVTYSVAFELGLFYFGFIFKVFDVLNT